MPVQQELIGRRRQELALADLILQSSISRPRHRLILALRPMVSHKPLPTEQTMVILLDLNIATHTMEQALEGRATQTIHTLLRFLPPASMEIIVVRRRRLLSTAIRS